MKKENKNVKRLKLKKYNSIYFLYKINNAFTERKLCQPFQPILVALSGGQDSICLLKVLVLLKKKWNWKIAIIHCDHKWNPASQLQAFHVASLSLNLALDYYEGITIEWIKKERIARIWRYDIIQTVGVSEKYSAIITGHTASDRIETLIYNLSRGSGLQGLQSLSWKRYIKSCLFTESFICRKNALPTFRKLKVIKTSFQIKIISKKKRNHLSLIRPFLEITRTEVRKLGNIWLFPSWPDLSNKDLKIRRNRIRHRLLPYFRKHYNPNIDETLSRWAEIVQSETLYLDKLTKYILSKLEIKVQIQFLDFYQTVLQVEILKSLPIAIQRRVLKKYIYKNTGQNLGFQAIEQIRLSCIFRTIVSEKLKKTEVSTSWIILSNRIKVLLIKNFIFLLK
jgi:tRNA(Ile)-lysidine synthase